MQWRSDMKELCGMCVCMWDTLHKIPFLKDFRSVVVVVFLGFFMLAI